MQAARNLGVPAALSGAGPSVVAFCDGSIKTESILQDAFSQKGVITRCFTLTTTDKGASVVGID